MAENRARPDEDVLDDVNARIASHPPLAADRHYVHVQVQGDVVRLSGNVKTPITRLLLVEQTAAVPGVRGVSAERLYDDETIRLEVGRRLPSGVFVNPTFGMVVLSGALPAGMSEAEVAQRAAETPGVSKVITAFR